MTNCPDPGIIRFPPTSPEELDSFFRDPWPDDYSAVVEMGFFRDVLKRILRRLTVKIITGELVIEGLAQGAYVIVHVDHTAKAVFEFCEHPRFEPVEGVEVLLHEVAADKATDGAGFVVKVTNVSVAAQGSVPTPITLCWQRRGMILK